MFMSPLESNFLPYSDSLIVTAQLVYKCQRTGKTYTVAKGFVSDGASIPRFLWPLIGHPFDYRWREESVLHDWFYVNGSPHSPKKMADLIFYDGLRAKGLRWTKAQAMYLGVRIGGRGAW